MLLACHHAGHTFMLAAFIFCQGGCDFTDKFSSTGLGEPQISQPTNTGEPEEDWSIKH